MLRSDTRSGQWLKPLKKEAQMFGNAIEDKDARHNDQAEWLKELREHPAENQQQ